MPLDLRLAPCPCLGVERRGRAAAKQWLSSPKAATMGTCCGFALLCPALLSPVQAGSVPKLLLALMQGMEPNHSHAGLSALEERQPPSPCWGPQTISHAAPRSHQVPDPSLLPYFMLSPKVAKQKGPCKVKGFVPTTSEPLSPACMMSGDAQAGRGCQRVYGPSLLSASQGFCH